MINFDHITKEDIIWHNPNWLDTPDYPWRILIVRGSVSGKTSALLNVLHCLFICKDQYKGKYPLLINKREITGLKYSNDSKAFIEYSNDMDVVYKNIKEYNLNKKQKNLIVFDDMMANMQNNKKLNQIVTNLVIRGRKLKISLVFITQTHFKVPKDVRLNATRFFIMQIKENLNKCRIIIHQILTLKS